jgi:hypothetical protein
MQGTEIDYVYWNNRFDSAIQGNYKPTRSSAIARLFIGVLHALNGAVALRNRLYLTQRQSLDTVSDQIDFIAERVAACAAYQQQGL